MDKYNGIGIATPIKSEAFDKFYFELIGPKTKFLPKDCLVKIIVKVNSLYPAVIASCESFDSEMSASLKYIKTKRTSLQQVADETEQQYMKNDLEDVLQLYAVTVLDDETISERSFFDSDDGGFTYTLNFMTKSNGTVDIYWSSSTMGMGQSYELLMQYSTNLRALIPDDLLKNYSICDYLS